MTAQRVCSRGGTVKNADPEPQQQLPFFIQPTNSQVSIRHRQVKPYSKRYLQDILWKESLLAVQVSMDCQTIAELVARLPEKLPQNSAVTRQRNTSTILSRFFPTEEIDQLPRLNLRINWLRVLGTAELAQIDQRVRHQLHAIVPLLDAFKSEQQALQFVFPRKGPLDTHA